jgi:hypothetical protein
METRTIVYNLVQENARLKHISKEILCKITHLTKRKKKQVLEVEQTNLVVNNK